MESNNLNLLNSKEDGKFFNVANVLYENRYCYQDDFSILVCGGYTNNFTVSNVVYELKGPSFESSIFPSMLEARYDSRNAVINSDIVVVGGYNEANKCLYSVEIFETNKNSWFYKTELSDKRKQFCFCAFKQNLYILGGNSYNGLILKSCFVYNIKCDKWSQIADINENRDDAACTVYEGRIVVTGGNNNERLKSVEAYDYHENKWTYLPDMIEPRSLHVSVSMGNNMFVIGGNIRSTFEIFESYSRKFCYLKKCSDLHNIVDRFQVICISNQVIIFCNVNTGWLKKVFTYNVETSKWNLNDCLILKNKSFNCVKYHQ